MNNTWIKLYRKTAENEIIQDAVAFTLFSFILLNVDRSSGQMKTGRFWLSNALKQDPSTIYKALKRLEKKYQVIEINSNKMGTSISVKNWAKYQSGDEMVTTEEQRGNNAVTLNKNKELRNKERDTDIEKTPKYLLDIPLTDIPTLIKETSATEKDVRSKGEELHNWLKSKGKERSYKDFKAFLRNAVKRDYPPKITMASQGVDYQVMKERGLAW